MRPEAATAPARLLDTVAVYEEPDDDLTGQTRTRAVALRLTLDLDAVYAVREVADYEAGAPSPGACYVNTPANSWALRDDYERVRAAWAAWRAHADALARLRN